MASRLKKGAGPAAGAVEGIVDQLAVADVTVSKEFYAGRSFTVTKGYGRKYVEFADPAAPVAFSLYMRADLA